MRCPECNSPSNSVIETRSSDRCVYRRRKCKDCNALFYTTEEITPSKKTSWLLRQTHYKYY